MISHFSQPFLFLFSVPGLHSSYGEYCQYHEGNGDRQRHNSGLGIAGYNVGYEGYGCHDHYIGELGIYMVDMAALGSRRGHDGGVGYRRAMVTADGTSHAGGDGNHHQLMVGGLEYGNNDGDKDTEGTPAGAGRKGKEPADKEDDGRQESHKVSGYDGHGGGDKFLGAEAVGHGLQSPGHSENQDGRSHGVDTGKEAVHGVTEVDDPPCLIGDEGDDEAEEAADREADRSVAVAEGLDEAGAGEKSAGINHAGDTADDNADDGYYEVNHFGLVFLGGLLFLILNGEGAGDVSNMAVDGLLFQRLHGAEVYLKQRDGNHGDNGEDGVKVIGYRLNEKDESVLTLDEAADGCRPRGYRGDDADRCGGGVDEVGQLCPGDVVPVGNGPHDAAHGEAVEVVINEDKQTEEHSAELGSDAGLDMFLRPVTEGSAAAGSVHKRNDCSEENKEDEDTHVVGVGQHLDKSVVEDMEDGSFKAAVGVQEGTENDTQEQ